MNGISTSLLIGRLHYAEKEPSMTSGATHVMCFYTCVFKSELAEEVLL